MPFKLKNPFRKTQKKRKAKSPKKLLSSGERARMSYLKTLLRAENKAADIKLGKELKDSFEKFLGTKKHSSPKRRRKDKTKKKKKKSKSKK